MKKNLIFKCLAACFLFLIIAVPSLADTINTLSKIVIDEPVNNQYDLNLFFADKFKGNAFIQDKEDGSYYIYIPDARTNLKNTRIIYKNAKDKSNIRISLEENPLAKDGSDSSYIRIAVSVKNNYEIRLFTLIDNALPVSSSKTFNYGALFALILLALSSAFIYYVVKLFRVKKSINNYTAFPHELVKNKEQQTDTPAQNSTNPISDDNKAIKKIQELEFPITETQDKEEKFIMPVQEITDIKKTLSSDNTAFSCFDIPMEEDKEMAYDLNKELKQKTESLKEKSTKSKVTTPIIKTTKKNNSLLDMPVAGEQRKIKIKKEDDNPELLSELKITPTKGFYLTTLNDTFALFGYTGEKVHLLQKFSDLTQINLQARYYDTSCGSDIYIVRLDNYKAMIAISDSEMKELSVL